MTDWITCPTCDGEGELWPYGEDSRPGDSIPCPDCVDGLIPSPELVESRIEVVTACEHGFRYSDGKHWAHYPGRVIDGRFNRYGWCEGGTRTPLDLDSLPADVRAALGAASRRGETK